MYFCVLRIICFVTFPVLFVCICVLNNCHWVAIQLQLNISNRISYHIHHTSYTIVLYIISYHIISSYHSIHHIHIYIIYISCIIYHHIISYHKQMRRSFYFCCKLKIVWRRYESLYFNVGIAVLTSTCLKLIYCSRMNAGTYVGWVGCPPRTAGSKGRSMAGKINGFN
jgi:hypothetical protein